MTTPDTALIQQAEAQALEHLDKYLAAFHNFERPLRLLLQRKYSPEEILEVEGKRCMLSVRGLQFHERIVYFQVTGLSIKEVAPYEGYDTFIEAPLRVINQFLARTLSGDEDAFGDLLASNDVRFRGQRCYNDMRAFEDACRLLASNIGRMLGVG